MIVVPVSARAFVLVRYVDGELHEHGGQVHAEGKWVACVSDDGRRVGLLDQDGERLRLLDLGPAPDQVHEAQAPTLPSGLLGDSILIADDVLYVGGHNDPTVSPEEALDGAPVRSKLRDTRGLEKLVCLDLRAEPRAWMPAPMWYDADSFNPRKSIDALFVDGARLLAIDDFMIPRYSLVYAIRGRAELELSDVVEMDTHTSYESVTTAALGDRWLAVISSGINYGDLQRFVSVLDRHSLYERFCYGQGSGGFGDSSWSTGELCDPFAITIVGEFLLIASGKSGLGLVDLRDYQPRPANTHDHGEPEPDDLIDPFRQTDPGPDVRYRKIAGLGSVDDVLAIPGHAACIVVEHRKLQPYVYRCVELRDEFIDAWDG